MAKIFNYIRDDGYYSFVRYFFRLGNIRSYKSTCLIIWITFIFDKYQRNSNTTTSAKYECDIHLVTNV